MENDQNTSIPNLSSLNPEATPSKPPTTSPLSPHERADLHRRFEVLSFELKRLEAGLREATDHGYSYLAAAGEDTLVYPLPACFIEVANNLWSEGWNTLHTGGDSAARVTVQLVETLVNTALAPENATLAAQDLNDAIAFNFDSVEVPIMRVAEPGNL